MSDLISRQAVLDIVKFEENWLFDAKSNNADTDIAFSSIRTQVAKLSPVTKEQESCEDCISRKALLDKKWDVPFDGKYIQVVDVGDIKELPSATLIRPKGHWINIDATHSKCDRCGTVFEIVSTNYCPNCGCRMESKEMN